MTRFYLLVNYDGGVLEEPMLNWDPADIKAHMAYYEALNDELTASGELVGGGRRCPGRRCRRSSDPMAGPRRS